MNNSTQDNSKRIAKNTLYLFFRMFLVLAVGLYTSRVVLETLGVEDYGLYNVVGSIVVFFGFLQQALNNATYRYLAYGIGVGDKEVLRNTFSMAINAHLILVGIILLLSETLGLWFLYNKLVIPVERMDAAIFAYQMSILCCCVNIIKTPYNSSIIAHEKMNFYAYTSIIEVVLKLLIVYLLVIGDFDKLKLYSFLILVVTLFMLLWYYLQCKKLFPECHYQKHWDGSLISNMVKYSGLSIIVNLVDVSVNQSIVFFFNIFFGLVANAALGIANQVNSQLTNFLNSFTQSYGPQIIKSYASGDKKYFMNLMFSSSKFSFFLLLLVSVPVLLNIDFILKLWLNNPPENASTFFMVVIWYSLVDAYSAPLWTGVHATGNIKGHQILMASIKILNIPLAYILLKFGSPAWTALLLKVVLNIICSVVRPCYVRKLYGLPLAKYFKEVLGVIYLTTAIMLPLPFYLANCMENGWNKLCITSMLFVAIAMPVIYIIGFNAKEKKMIRDVVQNKIINRFKKK